MTKPLLAESLPEVSSDHLTYTYTLRDGVKWHDGKPFTAEDVLFSAKVAMCPLVDAAPLRSTVTDLSNVEILEGRKIRFTMEQFGKRLNHDRLHVSKPNADQSRKLGIGTQHLAMN